MSALKSMLRPVKRAITGYAGRLNPVARRREIDSLYALLYQLSHDPERAIDLCAAQTQDAFAAQWENLETGKYLLSDPWFRENVDRILAEQELQIRPEWFAGKDVLDAGCGNGRWSYGFSRLGANVTSVDVNEVAVRKTREALAGCAVRHETAVTPLEQLDRAFPADRRFDLVFSWGVIHHAKSFTQCLEQLVRRVKDDGVLYLYLYGRESIPFSDDLELFKDRVRYNTLPSADAKREFLLKKAKGDESLVHYMHDVYAPLVNRRLEYPYVASILKSHGFEEVERTLDHTELFIRAIRSGARGFRANWALPRPTPPFWFQHHA